MPSEVCISSIDDIFAIFRSSNKDYWGDDLNSAWLFRGQIEARWPLLPSLWRPDELENYEFALEKIGELIEPHLDRWNEGLRGKTDLRCDREALAVLVRTNLLQRLLVRAFELVGQEIALIDTVPEDWGYEALETWDVEAALDHGFPQETIALAQHNGVPTFFLDWTRDPMKALWFAARPLAGEMTSAIWALDRKKLRQQSGNSRPHSIEVVIADRTKNAFLHAQDAVLTQITGFERYYAERGEFPRTEEIADALYPEGALRKYIFTIGPADRAEMVRRLWRERKSLPHLMPSLEHCAAFAKNLIQMGLFDRHI